MNLWNYAVIGASALVVFLVIIAVRLLWLLRQQNKKRKVALDELASIHQQKQQEQRVWLNKSIQILASSVGKEDISLTEASIRIAGLLEALDVGEDIKVEFSAFYQLREKTKHIPYLEAWQALTDAQQRQYDLERLQHEAIYQDFVMDAAQRILDRHF